MDSWLVGEGGSGRASGTSIEPSENLSRGSRRGRGQRPPPPPPPPQPQEEVC